MIIFNDTELNKLFNFIKENETLAYDIETDGLNVRKNRIIGFSITNSDTGYYIPHLQYDIATNSLIPAGPDINRIRKILQLLKEKKLVTFNGAFDISFTKNFFGIDLLDSMYCDVMLLCHTIDENRRSYALKEISADYFGENSKDDQQALFESIKANGGSPKEYFKANLEIMAKYAIKDGILTHKLMDTMLPQLQKDGLTDFFFKDECMPLYSGVTIPMEQHGIRLDMPLLQITHKEISQDIEELELKIQSAIKPYLADFEKWFMDKEFPPSRSGDFAQAFAEINELPLPKTASGKLSLAQKHIEKLEPGHAKNVLLKTEYMAPQELINVQKFLWRQAGDKYMFNLNSRHHLKKLFFDTLREEPINTTPTGLPQADEEFIESMTSKYPWCHDLIKYYKLMKIKGTYVERFIDESEGGRFYPKYFQHRTVSGRLSGDFQQLPRPLETDDIIAKYTNRIRAFFIADDNCIFIDDDYESAEPRTFAHISGEDSIKEIFARGDDFYSSMCILVENLSEYSANKKASNYLGKLNKAKRQQAKAYALGIPYHMSGYKLRYEIDVDLEVAENLVKKYLNSFPKLKKWMKETDELVLRQGYIVCDSGRIRRVPRAKQIYEKYGKIILDDLELWKNLNDSPGLYGQAKKERRELKNYLANGANFQIQGLVASMMNRAAIKINRTFIAQNLKAIIIGQMHDEIIVECSIEHKNSAAKIVQESMENTLSHSVKMPAVPSFGRNLRDAKN